MHSSIYGLLSNEKIQNALREGTQSQALKRSSTMKAPLIHGRIKLILVLLFTLGMLGVWVF